MSDPAPPLTPPMERHCDVAVVGGGAAGLAGALQVVRQRRSVIVLDAGEPRNAQAASVHGYLAREGAAPSELAALGREEVRSYGGEVLRARVERIERRADGAFALGLDSEHLVMARRVLAATGLLDLLPDIDGLAAQWGHGVIHCPFCHGFEARDRALVQILTHPLHLHTTALYRHLAASVAVVVAPGVEVPPAEVEVLRAGGVEVREGKVVRLITGPAGQVAGVELEGGERLEADVLAIGPRFSIRPDPWAGLGLAPSAHPSGLGDHLETGPDGATSVAGVWAAGNVTDPTMQVLAAAAAGSKAGAMIAMSLADEDLRRATPAGLGSADWDRRYSGEQLWSGSPNGALVAEVSDLPAGRALDVGAGEGGDALWLAQRGWAVTAADIASPALARVAALARQHGVEVTCLHADANAADPFPTAAFDLVSAHYASIPRTPEGRAVAAMARAVAPGGTLLVVGHDLAPTDPTNGAHGDARPSPAGEHGHGAGDAAPDPAGGHGHGAAGRPFDPEAYVGVDEVAAALDADPAWEIQRHERRPRPPGAASASHHIADIVLRARRLVS